MNTYWYNNPLILLNNYQQIIPYKHFTRIEKINSIARLSILIIILIIISKNDSKYLSIPIIMLGLTLFLGESEKFTSEDLNEFKQCTKPTINNPFMNFTLGDQIDNPDRAPACNYEDSRNEIKTLFNKHNHIDLGDIWGRKISDRQFYIMPNTRIVNNQTKFAEWCYGNSGKCKTDGEDCLKIRDPQYHRGRVV